MSSRKEGVLEVYLDGKWHKRYVICNEGQIQIFKDASDAKKKPPVSSYDVGMNVTFSPPVTDKKNYTFEAKGNKHTIKFRTSSKTDSEVWTTNLITPTTRGISIAGCNILKITLSGLKLAKMDSGIGAKSDPFFRMYQTITPNNVTVDYPGHIPRRSLIYHSEVVDKTLNPTWKSFDLDLVRVGGPNALVDIEIYDDDPDGAFDFMGKVENIVVKDLLCKGAQLTVLLNKKDAGKIVVNDVVALNQPVPEIKAYQFEVTMVDLPKMDGPFGLCDPFFEIWVRRVPSYSGPGTVPTPICIYRSEIVRKNLKPVFQPFILDLRDIDYYAQNVTIKAYDYDDDGEQEFIGEFTTTFQHLHYPNVRFYLINQSKKKNIGYKNSGICYVKNCTPAPPQDTKFTVFDFYSLKLVGKNIPMEGILKKPDPFFVLSTSKKTISRSDVCKDTQNPDWKPVIISSQDIFCPGCLGVDESITIDVYDWDPDGGHSLMTRVSTSIRNLQLNTARYPLDPKGEIVVSSISASGNPQTTTVAPAYKLVTAGMKLAAMDAGPLGKSDPYFEIRSDLGVLIHRSNIIKNSLNPDWNPFVISTESVGFYKRFRITVYDWDADGTHDLIGTCLTSLYELSLGPFQYPLIRNTGSGSGDIIVYGKSKSYGAFCLKSMEEAPVNMIPALPKGAQITCSASALPRMDSIAMGGKADPFFIVHTRIDNPKNPNVSDILYKSEIIRKELNPKWKPFILKTDLPLEKGYYKTFIISIYDYDKDGTHDCIGYVKLSLHEASYFPHMYKIVDASTGGFNVDLFVPMFEIEQLADPWQSLSTIKAMGLTISGQKFAKMDGGPMGKSDPWFRIRRKTSNITSYRSEVIMKSLDPEWKPFTFSLEGISSTLETFVISVYDWDKDGTHDLMGECEFSIKELTFSWLVKPILKNGKSMGALLFSDACPVFTFDARRLPVAIRMHCSAARLARMDGPLSKSDPYFVVKGSIKINAKTRQDVILYRSEVVYNNLDPTWKPFVLSVAELGGFDKPFSIIVYDFDADGSHDVMGQFTTTLNEYLFGPFQHAIMKGSNSSGAFSVDKVEPLGSIDVERIATSYRVGVSASKISPMDLNGKADPFFEVYAKPCVGYDWYDTEVNGFVSLNQLPPNLPLPPLVPDPTIYRPPQVPFIPNIVPIPNPQMMTNPYPQRPVLTIEEALQPPQQHSRYVLVPKFTNTEILLYRSEIKRKQLNPIWKDFELNLSIIGGIDVPFRILGRDWDADGTHDTIGEAFVTFREFLYGSFQRALKDGSSTKGGFNVDWIKKVEGTEKILPVAIKVECSAHKLANLDTGIGQKSDPLFEIIGKPYGAQSEITLYRSEVIMNNLSPKWQPFTLNVFDVGGYDTVFHVRVKDWDSDGSHDLIGELHTTIRNWSFGSFQQAIQLPGVYSESSSRGAFSVDFVSPLDHEERKNFLNAFEICPAALKLLAMDSGISAKSDPYFEIDVRNPLGNMVKLYRSEVIKQNLNPKWKPFCLNVPDVFGYDYEFTITVYDWDPDGEHDLIGSAKTCLREWIVTNGSYQFGLENGSRAAGAFSIEWMKPLDKPVPVPVPFRMPAAAYSMKPFALKIPQELTKALKCFFEIRTLPPGFSKPLILYRSEVVEAKDPIWKPFCLNTNDVATIDTPFEIHCFDYHTDGDHRFIGRNNSITIRELLYGWWCGTLSLPSSPSSKGGFCLEEVSPLPAAVSGKIFFPAYKIKPAGLKLAAKDLNGSSDPFFRISKITPGKLYTLYRSEVIKKERNPVWAPFVLNSSDIGGYDTEFLIEVFDWDKDGGHDLIGKATTTLREISFDWLSVKLLNGSTPSGAWATFSTPEGLNFPEYPPFTEAYVIHPSAQKLEAMDGPLKGSDPFFEVHATPKGYSQPIILYRSKVKENTLECTWDPFVLTMEDIRDFDTEFKISVYDFDKDGGHDLIGEVFTTFREWLFGPYNHGLYRKGRNGSRGAWSVDKIEPLPVAPVKAPLSPAYRIKAGGKKLRTSLLEEKSFFFQITATPFGFTNSITLYRSEVVDNSNDPEWKPFTLNMVDIRGIDTPFVVSVYNYYENGNHSLVGTFDTTFREWTFGPFRMALRKSGDGDWSAGAFAMEEMIPLPETEIKVQAPAYEMRFSAFGLVNPKLLANKSDPFFEIKIVENSKSKIIYRSEYLMNTKNIEWKPFILDLAEIKGFDSPITVDVYDWDQDGGHDHVGSLKTTFREWTFGRFHMALHLDGGSLSKGTFGVEMATPLPRQAPKTFAPAYKFFPSALKLERMDGVGSKSDPFFEIYGAPFGFRSPVILYRSEWITQNLNPVWSDFVLNVDNPDKEFEVKVYDWDEDGSHDLIGSFVCPFREFTLKWFSKGLYRSDRNGSRGAFVLTGFEPLSTPIHHNIDQAKAFKIKTSGEKIEGKDGIGSKSDPYFEVHGTPFGSAKPILLYRSEHIQNTDTPQWSDFVLNVDNVGGFDAPFTITVWDRDTDGGNDKIGTVTTYLRELNLRWFSGKIKGNRLLGKSSGAFKVDSISACLPSQLVQAPAYEFNVFSRKLGNVTVHGTKIAKFAPFFEIYSPQSHLVLHRSNWGKGSDVDWQPFTINMSDIGTIDTPFKVTVFHKSNSGKNIVIGSYHSTIREWIHRSYEKIECSSGQKAGAFAVKSVTPLIAPVKKTVIHPAYLISPKGSSLANEDGIGKKSDPFFTISQNNVIIYRSEVIKNNLDPVWTPFVINEADVGGIDRMFEVAVYDFDSDGSHDLIGKSTTNLRHWLWDWANIPLDKVNTIKKRGVFETGKWQPAPPSVTKIIAPAYEIKLRAQKLKRKIDCFFVISSGSLYAYRSELIVQTDSPSWKPFVLSSHLVNNQNYSHQPPFTVTLYEFSEVGCHRVVGKLQATLREWALGPFLFELKDPNAILVSNAGALGLDSIRAIPDFVPIPAPRYFNIGFNAKKLDAKDLNGSSDPFFLIKVGSYTVLRSEFIPANLNPKWSAVWSVDTEEIKLDADITIEVWDHDKDGAHDLIGNLKTTLREWMYDTIPDYRRNLSNPEKLNVMDYFGSGALQLTLAPTTTYQKRVFAPAYSIVPQAQKLARKDAAPGQSSDPFFIVRKKVGSSSIILYRSEVKMNSLDCSWSPFVINFDDIGGPNIPFKVEVWDWDSDGGHDVIGEFELTLTDIFLGPYTYAIKNSKYQGIPGYSSSGGFSLTTINPLNEPQLKIFPPSVEINASGQKLEIKDVDGSSDPFFEIRIQRAKTLFKSSSIFNLPPPSSSTNWVTHYRSEVCTKTTQPKWKPFALHLNEIGGMDVEIEIKCWDFDGDGGHDLIGILRTTYRELVLNSFQYKLVHPDKKNRIGYESSGAFSVNAIKPISLRSPDCPLLERIHLPVVPWIEPIAYKIKASGHKIVNVDVPIVGKSDPYFEIHKSHPGLPKSQVIYRSAHVANSSNPQWAEFVLLGATIGGIDEPFTVVVFDRDIDGLNTKIGNFTTTLREWLVGPFTHAIVNPSKVGRVGYESSGAWKMELITPLMEYEQPPIGQGMEIQCFGNKLDCIFGKDAYFEVWVIPPKISGSKKQITPWLYTRSGYGNDTSPSSDIKKSFSWKPLTIWYSLVGSFDVDIKIKVYSFDRLDGYPSLVGCCSFSLYELLIGPYLSPLIDKHKFRPGYKSSGGFEVKILNYSQNPPQFHSATGYNVRFRITELEKIDGAPPLGQFEVKSRPLGEDYKCTLYKHHWTTNHTYDIFFPFEGCGFGGPFEKLVWKFEYTKPFSLKPLVSKTYKAEFKASLYEFTLDNPTFFFKTDDAPIGRKHLGKIIVEEVKPVLQYIDGFTLTYSASNLDITDWYSTPAPYLIVKNSLGHVLYTSEIHGYSQQPQWLPFSLTLQSVGGMDEEILLECWTSHGNAYPPEFVGYQKISFRKLCYASAARETSVLLKNDAVQARRPYDNYNAGTLTLLDMKQILAPQGLEWKQPLKI